MEKYISYSEDGNISVAVFTFEIEDEEAETFTRYGWYYGYDRVGSGFAEQFFKKVDDLGCEEISHKSGDNQCTCALCAERTTGIS